MPKRNWSTLVTGVRRKLGQLIGRPLAPRELVARLIGCSPGSIFNWEQGGTPIAAHAARLEELAKRIDAGVLSIAEVRRVWRPRAPKAKPATKAKPVQHLNGNGTRPPRARSRGRRLQAVR